MSRRTLLPLQLRASGWAAILALPMAAVIAVCPAVAQQSLPGLVVTVPPSSAAPPPPAEEPPPAPKPKAKAASPAKSPPTQPSSNTRSKSASLTPGEGKTSSGGQSIVVLVNDDPITGYEIDQRARLMALSTNVNERAQDNFKRLIQQDSTNQRLKEILQETIQANQGKSREQILAIFEQRKQQFAKGLQAQAVESARAGVLPGLKKQALEELIDERLKLQEAKRINIQTEDSQIDGIIRNIAERNKMTTEQFAQHLKSMGADIEAMKARYRALIAWNDVVRRRFSAMVSVNQRDIDRLVSTSAESGEDEVELQLHRITLAIPAKMDQKAMAQRFEEADHLRRNFAGCRTTRVLASKAANAKFEDLGTKKPSIVQEPTRSMLLAAKEDEMVPPSLSAQGIELYAVCKRSVLKADDQKRDRAAQELQQREFEVLAKRHLRDLRQDAHIEYR
jgi:peptidyl-prolyl cis-trans isomerase SurA